ncbi:MAG TPA: FCD domain-containing protein, partial [Oscillospiraceae bacterium]|nr:FCD domain-containing protein [Oscillospiraceae bacterium]
ERTRMQFTIYSNAYQSDETNRREIQREHDQILHYLEAGDDETAEAALRRHSAASFDKALEVLNARG